LSTALTGRAAHAYRVSKSTQTIITIATLAVAAAAAWASADSLLRLATEAGVTPAFAIPVSIDGAGTVAAFSLLLGQARATRAARAYANGIVALMVVVSAAANFLSAQGIQLTGAERGWVSTIPPISLALVLHMALSRAGGAANVTKPRPVNARAARAVPATPASSKAAASAGSGSAGLKGNTPKDRAAVLQRITDHFAATGEWPSGPTVAGEWLGGEVSRKTGSRLVAAARSAEGE
jgi:hypothetical protein